MRATTDTARSRSDSVHSRHEIAHPTASEARLYLRTRGLRATIQKAFAAYFGGRLENLTQWNGVPFQAAPCVLVYLWTVKLRRGDCRPVYKVRLNPRL